MSGVGVIALAGIVVNNNIVLIDTYNRLRARGMPPREAVLRTGAQRLRPVLLAAGTTVLGVIPLLKDVFWIGLAVTIMAGLSFGTILTMVLVPVLYATLYRLRPAKAGA